MRLIGQKVEGLCVKVESEREQALAAAAAARPAKPSNSNLGSQRADLRGDEQR
jgi:hypothetical protein